jgi:hypothetical protein
MSEDLFEPIAGLNDPGVLASFIYGLTKAREHLIRAKRLAESSGRHEDLQGVQLQGIKLRYNKFAPVREICISLYCFNQEM